MNNMLRSLEILCIVAFVAFLIYAGSRQNMNFDASYNLLSYQSLFDGNGFVYTYSGKSIPFDPVISTGPELYLPAFLVWKILGHTGYSVAAYVLVFYYAAFLFFFRSSVLPKHTFRFAAVLLCICLFMCKQSFFQWRLYVTPLGEPIAAFLVFTGLFLLHRKRYFAGFLTLGFALDVKTNIVVPLIPTVALFLFREHLLPVLKRGVPLPSRGRLATMVFCFGLMFLPNVLYTKVVPALTLDPPELTALRSAQAARSRHMLNNGFARVLPLIKKPTEKNLTRFWSEIPAKWQYMQHFYGKNIFLTGLFCLLLVWFTLIALKRNSFLFYVFIFSAIVIVWWLTCPYATFYRYFVIAEFLFLFASVTLTAQLIDGNHRRTAGAALAALLLLYLPQFSIEPIRKSLDNTELQQLHAMKNELRGIDERQIFTPGWFQAPELMLLTHKRFQNFYDSDVLAASKKLFPRLYLLATRPAMLYSEFFGRHDARATLLVDHGAVRLYALQ